MSEAAMDTPVADPPKTPKKPPLFRRWIDDPNPILVKELRTIFRTKLFIRFLYLSTGLIGLIVLSGGAAVAAGSMPPAEVGQFVFQMFFTIALMVICLVAPAHAATALTGEREKGTYESLILTGMDPAKVVWGKFLASYCVFALVIIAFSPIVGIAFLFGGISPLHVLFGFYGLFLVLAPAVALGVAISARLRSSRVSILLALLIFVPTAMFSTGMMAAFGEVAEREWGLAMSGPFWFSEALSQRFFEPNTFGLLGALPLYFFGMSVWFLIASAIAGVRPPAEDRSTPFKWWALFATLGAIGTMFGTTMLFDRGDIGEVSVVFNIMAWFFQLFVALLFMNEPPLAPRQVELRREEKGTSVFSFFGPGAAPTTRFAAIFVVVLCMGQALASIAARHLAYPMFTEHARWDVALLVLGLGNTVTCLFLLGLGAYLRVILRSGVAARVLSLAVVFGLIVLPLLASVIVDPDSLDDLDDEIPLLVMASPLCHMFLSVGIGDGSRADRVFELLAPVTLYGSLAWLFWFLLEVRVRKVHELVRAQRAQREERAHEAAKRRISLIPPAARGVAAAVAGEDASAADLAAAGVAAAAAGASASDMAAAAAAAVEAGDGSASVEGAPGETSVADASAPASEVGAASELAGASVPRETLSLADASVSAETSSLADASVPAAPAAGQADSRASNRGGGSASGARIAAEADALVGGEGGEDDD